ncbi:MAG: hypothetical protein JNM21_12340 [Taibaiella sp.]|nr:hypothetical protein [Taibaiella sp.]
MNEAFEIHIVNEKKDNDTFFYDIGGRVLTKISVGMVLYTSSNDAYIIISIKSYNRNIDNAYPPMGCEIAIKGEVKLKVNKTLYIR